MSVPDHDAFITEWFISSKSGQKHALKEVNATSTDASWSGDNLQVQQDTGATRNLEFIVYQFDTR